MIRVGLVGFGLGGRVLHAPVIASVEGLELAAVVERSTNRAAERYPGITTYCSLGQMLADDSLELIVLTTPSGTHFELGREILQADRHLVIDKPMCMASAEVAELMHLARKRSRLLVPYHNRRWDADFRTVQRELDDNALGRLVAFEAAMDRWKPGATRAAWKDDFSRGGGRLFDLGSHMVYLALALFGTPAAVGAEIERQREDAGADDAFTLRLRYPGWVATLAASSYGADPRPSFRLTGTHGSFVKYGVDPQEAALQTSARIADADWGRERESEWGERTVERDGQLCRLRVASLPGDYRLFYAGMREAVLGKAPAPVAPLEGWRTIRILEYALESARQRREIDCDWSREPEGGCGGGFSAVRGSV